MKIIEVKDILNQVGYVRITEDGKIQLSSDRKKWRAIRGKRIDFKMVFSIDEAYKLLTENIKQSGNILSAKVVNL